MAPPRQTFCRRGHRIDEDPYVFPNGKRVCRQCRTIWSLAQHTKARHLEPGLIPLYGQPFVQALRHYKAVILRRARFGRSLRPPEQRAAQIASGHRLQRDYPGQGLPGRRSRRPQWLHLSPTTRVSIAAHDRFHRREVARLRAVMIAAHPDKGGTTWRFIRAKRALDAFLRRDAQWYRQFDLVLPGKAAA